MQTRFALAQARKACRGAAALSALLPPEDRLPQLLGFRLGAISQAVYVDGAGRQRGVAFEELDAALLDPLALTQHDLLAAVNQSPDWRTQLQLFAAAYLGVACRRVLLEGADRLGFTLLGEPLRGGGGGGGAAGEEGAGEAVMSNAAQQPQQERWRQFRIGSSRELRNGEAFMELLQQMREEVRAVAGPQ
jgi:hypothetical protein